MLLLGKGINQGRCKDSKRDIGEGRQGRIQKREGWGREAFLLCMSYDDIFTYFR